MGVISLGAAPGGGHAPAMPPCEDRAAACLVALGRIGTAPAADALQAFAQRSGEKRAVDALLDAAESLYRHAKRRRRRRQKHLAADSESVRAACVPPAFVAAKPSSRSP